MREKKKTGRPPLPDDLRCRDYPATVYMPKAEREALREQAKRMNMSESRLMLLCWRAMAAKDFKGIEAEKGGGD